MTIQEQVAEISGTFAQDWEFISGPDSGNGVDYWLRNTRNGQEAYVNDDQGEVSISIQPLEEVS